MIIPIVVVTVELSSLKVRETFVFSLPVYGPRTNSSFPPPKKNKRQNKSTTLHSYIRAAVQVLGSRLWIPFPFCIL